MSLSYWGATWAILVPGILYASWVDGTEKRVPNWLNALLLSAGIAMQCWHSEGAGLKVALGGCAGRLWRVDRALDRSRNGCR